MSKKFLYLYIVFSSLLLVILAAGFININVKFSHLQKAVDKTYDIVGSDNSSNGINDVGNNLQSVSNKADEINDKLDDLQRTVRDLCIGNNLTC